IRASEVPAGSDGGRQVGGPSAVPGPDRGFPWGLVPPWLKPFAPPRMSSLLMPGRARAAAVAFRILGIAVIGLGVLHLYATVLVRDYVLARISDASLRGFISPGYLLNHILVGVLLLPMGLLMVWSSWALGAGERWAYVVNLVFSLTLLTFPVLIVAVMAGP